MISYKAMKKCLVVSDSFKGTLSSKDICNIAKECFSEHFPDWELRCIPVADGGEGTVDCFISALNAEPVHLEVSGPYGEPINTYYARFQDKAVIEMASAAGLPLVGENRNPALAGTFGVGEMIDHAVKSGCKDILLGLGGSAGNDGGCGCAAALGTAFYNESGEKFIPTGSTLCNIAHIDCTDTEKLLSDIKITVMSDVTNPLYGPNGAAHIFAPQKGADEQMVEALDNGLIHLSRIIERDLAISVSDIPGAGAAGGMGAGCTAFLGGKISSGIDAVLNLTGFDEALKDASLVITGEGKIDSQSIHGKVISGISRRTQKQNVPLIVIAGCIDDSAALAYEYGIKAMFSTNRCGLPLNELRDRAALDYKSTLCDVMNAINLL